MLLSGEKPSKRGLLTYASAASLVSVFYLIFLPDLESLPYSQYVIESILSLLMLLVALALSELVYVLLVSKIDDLHSRLSVGRLVKAAFILLAIAAIISFIFKELIISVTSFGIIGLILSYSLAPVISNFFLGLRQRQEDLHDRRQREDRRRQGNCNRHRLPYDHPDRDRRRVLLLVGDREAAHHPELKRPL